MRGIIRAMLFALDRVSLFRGGNAVLRELSAELPDGASAVLGPSGSGKSTLLRLLNRLAEPDAGTVRFRGRDVRELDPLALRREACLVGQLPALLDGTVADNVEFAASCAGVEADVARCLRLAGLDPDFAARDGSRLSVGEQQRVMLARALALRPRVLLLDEPTAALDPAAREAIERTLAELRREPGLALVLVTHDHEQAARMAEWVVRIEAGSAVAAGPARELLPV